jgi:acyl-CoA dehydrogenase
MSNQVLDNQFVPFSNFFRHDLAFRHFLSSQLSPDAYQYMHPKLDRLGSQAANELTHLAATADKQPPQLNKRNHLGETINQINFHPAYWQMIDLAVQSEMFSVKWQPDLRQRFAAELHQLGFAAGFLFSMAEAGVYCPLCMTDGVARLIDRYCTDEDKTRLLPHIYTQNANELYTGAMFLTEKAGGSDVGANLVTATKQADGTYWLNGEKWFCSNANAQIIFALARTNPAIKGTKGLSIFLVEPYSTTSIKNSLDIVRLKDKLGVRSMASAECIFTNTPAKLVGTEGQGFKIMTDMINLSRLYNSVSAIGLTRRALVESYHFLCHRTTFGTNALEHALIRHKLWELGSKYLAHFYLTFHTIQVLDKADNHHPKYIELIRLLTPMLKKATAQNAVYSIRECMELMGGLGYIEDGIMPRLMRDAMVLPIWEGAGNIMTLDMLRAIFKSEGLSILNDEISSIYNAHNCKHFVDTHLQPIMELAKKLPNLPPNICEVTAHHVFEQLSLLYQFAMLLHYTDTKSEAWMKVAASYYSLQLSPMQNDVQNSICRQDIETLMAWEV